MPGGGRVAARYALTDAGAALRHHERGISGKIVLVPGLAPSIARAA